MKRRDFLRTGAATALGTVASPTIAQSMPAIKWRLVSAFPKSLDTLFGGSQHLARIVANATDNQFQIQAFAAGEVVPGSGAVVDAASNGTV